jgi:hypothetical protein
MTIGDRLSVYNWEIGEYLMLCNLSLLHVHRGNDTSIVRGGGCVFTGGAYDRLHFKLIQPLVRGWNVGTPIPF